jgi:hypothetical protein
MSFSKEVHMEQREQPHYTSVASPSRSSASRSGMRVGMMRASASLGVR